MRLVRDRYITWEGNRLLDLATGLVGDTESLREDIDGEAPLWPLVEILEHGREGEPRWVAARLDSIRNMERLRRRAATDASVRGVVPVGVEVYVALRAQLQLDDLLKDRTLLLMEKPGPISSNGRLAFLDAAVRSPRPHVLLTLHCGSTRASSVAREARAAYDTNPTRTRQLPAIDADVEHHLRRASRAESFVQAGRHAAAERLLRDVVGCLARRGRMALSARVLIDLGRIILDRGRTSDAEQVFSEAGTAAGTVADEALVAEVRLWQAASRTDADRLTEAEALCRAVLAACRLDRGRRAWARATLARVLLWQGRIAEALELDLSVPDDQEPDAAAVAFVRGVEVRVLLAAGRVFAAGLCASRLAADAVAWSPRARGVVAAAQLRFLVAAGALDLASAKLQEATALARGTGSPLRALKARALWASGLLRAGRTEEARLELRRLERWCRVAPPLFRRAIRELARAFENGRPEPDGRGPIPSSVCQPGTSPAVAMIVAAQDEESDRDAVSRILDLAREALGTSRIDVCSVDAGPVSAILSVGTGLPTRLGTRVLEAGLALGPEAAGPGSEIGVPARRGMHLVAAIVARWPADRRPPPHAREVLDMAAAVAFPRIEALIATGRTFSVQKVSAMPELIGVSRAMEDLRAAVTRAAGAPFSVLIQGESGVGKELVARAIHQLGARRERRFCDINCAALPDDLLESELFGHARGAFTGAVSDRPGLFEDADGGTVFLDELADLSARGQAKLLRVLQQHEIRRVGETFSRKVDVRVVTAANRDMEAEVASGRFRQDLLYRLDVIRIRIPALRERSEDVPPLAQHFWQGASQRVGTSARLTHGVLAALARYHWPGNVRELQNVMSALAVAAPSRGHVRTPLLPPVIAGATTVTCARLADARAQFERRAIESALARSGGSRTRAARELGLSRQGLLKMMSRLRLT
jgi:DNA-binding NtrC family response regulator/tetratricopeptide (TPR) repeat protein